MAVSVRDVAAAASVSVGTVSNVLNRPDKVAPATVERVHAAIEELGFVRNDAARQLRAGRSRSIGLVVLDVRNPFFTDVARGAEDRAAEDGMTILLGNSDENTDREGSYLDLFEEQRVHGVLISPLADDLPRLDRLPRTRHAGGARRPRGRGPQLLLGRRRRRRGRRARRAPPRRDRTSPRRVRRRPVEHPPGRRSPRGRASRGRGDAGDDARGHRDRLADRAAGSCGGRGDPRASGRRATRRDVRGERPARHGRAAGAHDAGLGARARRDRAHRLRRHRLRLGRRGAALVDPPAGVAHRLHRGRPAPEGGRAAARTSSGSRWCSSPSWSCAPRPGADGTARTGSGRRPLRRRLGKRAARGPVGVRGRGARRGDVSMRRRDVAMRRRAVAMVRPRHRDRRGERDLLGEVGGHESLVRHRRHELPVLSEVARQGGPVAHDPHGSRGDDRDRGRRGIRESNDRPPAGSRMPREVHSPCEHEPAEADERGDAGRDRRHAERPARTPRCRRRRRRSGRRSGCRRRGSPCRAPSRGRGARDRSSSARTRWRW